MSGPLNQCDRDELTTVYSSTRRPGDMPEAVWEKAERQTITMSVQSAVTVAFGLSNPLLAGRIQIAADSAGTLERN